jgi:multidrug efflux pump subunit AcrA (membrane-fusion protein)
VTATVTGLAAEVTRDRRVAIAEAIVLEPPADWLPGMYAEANVTIKALENVLVVPSVSVLSRLTPDGRVETGVFIADEGFARWVRVDVLAREGDRVGVAPAAAPAVRDPESTASSVRLTDGAKVLTAGHVDLTDGSAIKVAEEPRAEAR